MDYSALARSYSALCFPNQLREILTSFFKSDEYNHLNKYELAKKINDSLFTNYDGEQILKYKLAKEFRNRNYVAAFEVNAKNSRTDFLVINGNTKSFEVKSKLDTLKRLKKQVADFGDVFEYNYVVVDKKHLEGVKSLVPEYYGIWYYENSKKIIHKEASYSPLLNPSEQLKLFNKKELTRAFKNTSKDYILEFYSSEQINLALKQTLKARYIDRWNFVKDNWSYILPIDLQFFFNTNVCPKIIYDC